MDLYESTAATTRAALAKDADLKEFIRYATLAGNAHNTQPWKFRTEKSTVVIQPDFSRHTPVVDPDDHHLFASLGCAAENFVLASEARGRPADIRFDPDDPGRVIIDYVWGKDKESELFQAIPYRQCTRSEYDGEPVSPGDVRLLEKAGSLDGVNLIIFTDKKSKESVLDYVIEANRLQIDDPEFVAELKKWIRFNPAQALSSRDGLFSGCTGNPSMPTWLGNIIFSFVFTKGSENDRYAKQIRSSSGIAILISDKDDKEHWVKAGRSYQRFALQATALGIRHAFINQPVEVTEIRAEFAKWLGEQNKRPDLVLRFGYAPSLPMSLRRPVEDILI